MAASNAQVDEVATVAIVPFRKAPARLSARQIIKSIGDRTIDEAIAEREVKKQQVEANLEELLAAVKAQSAQAEEARAEFDQAHAEVATKIEDEMEAVQEVRKLRLSKAEKCSETYALRTQLFEAQKKVALLEVIAVNREKMKEITEKAKAAAKAAEEATRQISEEKKLIKQQLAATHRAWVDMDAKGSKRPARSTACEADEELTSSKRPKVDGMPVASPMVSQSTLKNSACDEDDVATTLVQSPKRAEVELEQATLVDDAQEPEDFD
jgi:hypothetical protein